jgi:hypothetical protein
MNPVEGYFLIKPEDPHWRPSNLMKITLFYPIDPKQLRPELSGVALPPDA